MTDSSKKSPTPATPQALDSVRAAARQAAEALQRASPVEAPKRTSRAPVTKGAKPVSRAEKMVSASLGVIESGSSPISELKARCLSLGIRAKKSEILAAAVRVLQNLPDRALESAILPCITSDQTVFKIKKRKR